MNKQVVQDISNVGNKAIDIVHVNYDDTHVDVDSKYDVDLIEITFIIQLLLSLLILLI